MRTDDKQRRMSSTFSPFTHFHLPSFRKCGRAGRCRPESMANNESVKRSCRWRQGHGADRSPATLAPEHSVGKPNYTSAFEFPPFPFVHPTCKTITQKYAPSFPYVVRSGPFNQQNAFKLCFCTYIRNDSSFIYYIQK